MFCTKCGYQVNDDCRFCPKCGSFLGNQAEKTPKDEAHKDFFEEATEAKANDKIVEEAPVVNSAEPTAYEVVVVDVGSKRIDFMKFVMAKFDADLSAAKKITESVPVSIDIFDREEDALKFAMEVSDLGVKVEVRPSYNVNGGGVLTASTKESSQYTQEEKKKMFSSGTVLTLISSVFSLLTTLFFICLPLIEDEAVIGLCYYAIESILSHGFSVSTHLLFSYIYIVVAIAVISILVNNIKILVTSIKAQANVKENFEAMLNKRSTNTMETILKDSKGNQSGKVWGSLISEVAIVFLLSGGGQIVITSLIIIISCAVAALVLDKIASNLKNNASK